MHSVCNISFSCFDFGSSGTEVVRVVLAETNNPELEQNCPAGMISILNSSGLSGFGRDNPP